jgi:hypothetical protein
VHRFGAFQEDVMQTFNNHYPGSSEATVFTVRVEGKTYRCPVSQEAIYELCRRQDPTFDRIDSYLALKAKISRAAERILKTGTGALPVLQPEHFAA